MMNKIYVACAENGELIDIVESIAEAKRLIDSYESEDRENGCFAPNCYDVETEAHRSVYAYSEGNGSVIDAEFLRENGYIDRPEPMTFAELYDRSGMLLTHLSTRFGIPYRTLQGWKLGERKAPQYVIDMMAEILGIR